MRFLLLMLLSFNAWAATYYIDGQAADGGSGTEVSPYNGREDFSITSNNSYLFKRGSTVNFSAKETATSVDSVTIGAYGTGDAPIITNYITTVEGEWTEISTNLWERDTCAYACRTNFVMFGTLGSSGVGNEVDYDNETSGGVVTPSAAKEYGSDSDATQSTVVVYSVGNPVTYYGAVYIQHSDGMAFDFVTSTNVTVENIKGMYGHMLFRFTANAATTYAANVANDVETEYMVHGIQYNGSTSARGFTASGIDGYTCSNSLRTCAYVQGILPSGWIRDFTFTNCGLIRSQGCVYVDNGASSPPFVVSGGTCDTASYGDFYTNDGGCFEVDSAGGGVTFTRNFAKNTHEFLHDNSGTAGIKAINNVALNVDRLLYVSDATNIGTADTTLYGNSIYNCGGTVVYDNPDGFDACVRVADTDGTSVITLNNNAFYGASGSVDCLHLGGGEVSNTLVDDYNDCYNTTYLRRKGTGEETPGTSSINSDPKWAQRTPTTADGFRLAADSPLRGAGVYISGGIQDYGNRRCGFPPDIGAWCVGSGDARETVSGRTTINTRSTITTRTTVNPR